MKIIHCADLHLGSKMESKFSSEQSKKRKNEVYGAYLRMLEYADKNDVEAVVFAGDVFDVKQASLKARDLFIGEIAKRKNIRFFYLAGNHDEENYVCEGLSVPENFYTFSDKFSSTELGDVTIGGVEITKINSGSFYDEISFKKENFNILVLHGETSKYKNDAKAENINLTLLKDKNIDYLALGHYHSYCKEKLSVRGVYCYSGCLEGRGFDETGEKGFIIIDTIEKTSEFILNSERIISIIEVDITGINSRTEIEEKIIDELAGIKNGGIVRVKLIGEYTIDSIKPYDIFSEKMNQKYFYFEIKDESRLKVEEKDYENDFSLKGEFVRLVKGDDKLSDDDKTDVLLCGLTALKGEKD